MPSLRHEVIIDLFRQRTVLAPELLERALAMRLPHYTKAVTAEADFPQLVPTSYHADLVILLEDEVPVFGVVVEAQLAKDEDKYYSWPVYASVLRARHKIPVVVLVVTPYEYVAEWARAAIWSGAIPFGVEVLGPSAIPVVTTEADALAAPELAVLSAIAHGRDPDAGEAVATAAAAGLRTVDDKLRRLYYDLIFASGSVAAQRGLRAMVESRKYEYISDFAKEHFAAGRQEGREEGRKEGERAASARHLLRVLVARKLLVDGQVIEAKLEAASPAQLESWLDRAAVAESLDRVFADD